MDNKLAELKLIAERPEPTSPVPPPPAKHPIWELLLFFLGVAIALLCIFFVKSEAISPSFLISSMSVAAGLMVWIQHRTTNRERVRMRRFREQWDTFIADHRQWIKDKDNYHNWKFQCEMAEIRKILHPDGDV